MKYGLLIGLNYCLSDRSIFLIDLQYAKYKCSCGGDISLKVNFEPMLNTPNVNGIVGVIFYTKIILNQMKLICLWYSQKAKI